MTAGKGKCVKCSDNCYGCAGSSTHCTACHDNYQLDSENKCEIITCELPSCQKCMKYNDTQCELCDPGYFSHKDTYHCEPCAGDCLTCSNHDDTLGKNCTSCKSGFYLSVLSESMNTCEKCSSNCLECSTSASNCTQCASGKYLANNTPGSASCAICSTNCLNCQRAPANCTACLTNYALNSQEHTCEVSFCAASGCKTCMKYNDIQCQTCSAKYFLHTPTNSCIACSANCQGCSSATNCSSCVESYGLNQTTLSCDPCVANCAQCSGPKLATECSVCKTNFFLNNATRGCDKCPLNCLECDTTGSCTRCRFFMSWRPQANQCDHIMNSWLFTFLCMLLLGAGVAVLFYLKRSKTSQVTNIEVGLEYNEGVSFQKL